MSIHSVGRMGLLLTVFMAFSSSEAAYLKQFSVNSVQSLAYLEAISEFDDGKVVTTTEWQGESAIVDASAVFKNVDLEKLYAVSIDYGRYNKMGLPNLRDAVYVGYSDPSTLYTWSAMELMGLSWLTSRHFFKVGLFPTIPDQEGSKGTAWELVSKSEIPSQSTISIPGRCKDEPSFDTLYGSWYLKQVTPDSVYIRYYLQADPSLPIPGFARSVVERELESGVRKMVWAFVTHARMKLD